VVRTTSEPSPIDPLTTGQEALACGAWEEARLAFEAALTQQETPEALEGLDMAAWWRDDAAVTFAARERAYHLYRQQGDCRGAARLATYLAYDYYSSAASTPSPLAGSSAPIACWMDSISVPSRACSLSMRVLSRSCCAMIPLRRGSSAHRQP
jgi:hypothetical protein